MTGHWSIAEVAQHEHQGRSMKKTTSDEVATTSDETTTRHDDATSTEAAHEMIEATTNMPMVFIEGALKAGRNLDRHWVSAQQTIRSVELRLCSNYLYRLRSAAQFSCAIFIFVQLYCIVV
jgi:hypothetical protein